MIAEETARLQDCSANQVGRGRDTIFVSVGRRARTLDRQRIKMSAALSPIEPERARLLLNYFGNIAAFTQAAQKGLAKVKAIGKRIARQIRLVAAGNKTSLADLPCTPEGGKMHLNN